MPMARGSHPRPRSADRWLEVLLGLLVLFVFAGRPLLDAVPAADPIIEVVFSLVLASGVAATTGGAASLAIGVLAATAIAAGWAAWGTHYLVLREIRAVVSLAYCSTLAAVVLAQVFRPGEVRRHHIEGAVAAYLLIGLAWTFAYNLVFLLRPDSFSFSSGIAAHDSDVVGRFLYFSFVTLTTIGYGDITPTTSTTEMMAVLEALVGQLFPAVLLARLVSMELHHRLQREAHRAG